MTSSVLLTLLAVLLLMFVLSELSGKGRVDAFLKGPCKKKRWSRCETKLRFSIVKRSGKIKAGEKGKEILIENWKEIVKRRTGSISRSAMMKVLKDMGANIVADISLPNDE